MPSSIVAACLLVPACAGAGYWFSRHGHATVAFRVLKLLHTSYCLVLGLTLLALYLSTPRQGSLDAWTTWFVTNMFIALYAWIALPFMAGFFCGQRLEKAGVVKKQLKS